MALQFRRGTDSDRLTITPAAGEPIFTSDTKELFIGDGSTAGGVDLITTKLGSISGNIVPDTDSAYDLGSPTKKFKDLHLSGNSIFLGTGLVLSNDGGTFAAKDSDNNPVVISLASNNTGQLSEGTNLYYTTARADSAFDVRLATKTTANVTEGSNLYFTNARADARITNALLDEDNMASNSATKIPSQQSVKAYVDAEVAGIVDTAPAALNTLNELAAALGDDANFSTTITTSIGTKLTSAQTTALIDSAYVQARQTSGGIDSAATIALVDSAYVQARQTSGGGGIDSAATTALVDSAYVQVRQVTPVSSFNTIAVSGQTNIIADSAGTTNYAATVQQAILQASNRGQDYFGQRVAIDNGYAIVNADNEDTGGSNAGSVYVYVRSGTTWSQQQQITSPISPPDNHYFGTDVDIEGSRIVIGSKYDDTDYNQGGGVHVYTRSGTTWSLEQRLASTDIAANDWFGDRVAISGNYIVASAHKKNSSEGAVYVFYYNGSTWAQQAKLLASDNTAGDKFGFDVAIDGDTIAIGAAVADTGGKVYAFTRSGTTWSQQAAFTSSDVSSEDEFGGSVSISGNTILVGAYSSGGTSSAPHGAAYAFTRSGTTWSQQAKIQPSDTPNPSSATIAFAYRQLAIENDIAVIGHSSATLDGTANVGAAYIFERSGTTWSQVYKFGASDATASDAFGHGIDISGKDVIVGAPSENNGKGQAYTFVLPNAATYSDTLTLAAGTGITITTNATTDTVTIAGSAAGNDSATTIALIDSAYVQARQTKYTNADFTDSAYVTTQINSVIDAAPGALNTLNELAAALGDDANFSTTITNQIAGKLDSAATIALVDSSYVQARQTSGGGGNDSAATIALVDSAYVQARQITPIPNFNKISISGQGDVVADADAAVANWASGTQQQKLTASDTASNDRFGYDLDISGDGNYALVAAPWESTQKGKAYVYLRTGTTWSEQATLTGSDTSSNDYFGIGIKISEDGSTAVIGAKGAGSGLNGTGKAYVYTRSGTSWSQQAALTASDAADGDLFGSAVDISDDGDTIVVGAYGEDTGGNARGQIYVYTRSGTTWSEQQKFQPSDVEDGDNTGFAVGISGDGDNIIAGVPFEDTNGSAAGSGYIFTRSGSTWSQQAKIQASDAAAAQDFGYSVDISTDGNTVALGSRDDTGGDNRGAAFIFTRSGTTWSQQAKIENSNEADGDFFASGGRGVSLSGTGNILVVGAYSDDDNGSQSGSTFVFTRSGTTWSQAKQIATSDAAASDTNGFAVAIDKNGDTLLTGSYGKNSSAGATYVWTAPVAVQLEDTLTLEAGTGITLTTAAGTDTVTIAGSAGGNDSATTIALIDSAYVQARQTSGNDSATTIALIDSAYVQARQTSGGGGNDSATTIALVDSDYVQARQITPISSFNTVTVASVDVVADATGVHWPTTGQNQKVTASDAANNDFFGNVVDIDGDYAVVGARGNKAAYILYYNGSAWTEQQKIQETTFGSNFGHSVSISGDTVVIGSNNEDVSSSDGTKAYVYTRSGTTWSLQQKVDPSQAHQGDYFGYQRTMKLDKSNSDQFIAGAYSEDQSYSAEGAVYIFTRSGTTWSEQQRIVPSGSAVNANYGVTADIAGDYAVFGGRPGNNFAVYVWTRSGTTWSQQAALTQPSGHTNSQYAYASGLSINSAGDTIAVGAYGNTSNQAGKVFIFTRSGTTWTNQAVIQPSDTATGDYFGWECRLDTTGNILTVGAKLASTGGKVYIFTRSGTTWTEATGITASDVASNWEFGEDVGIDGTNNKIIVGARQNSSSASGQGAAYVFNAGATAKYSDTLTLEAGSNITITTNPSTDTVTIAGSTVDELISIDSNLTSIDSDQVIHSFSKTSFRTMKYIAQLKHAGDNAYHSEEILLTHNGTNVAITGYAKLLLDSDLGEFDAAINGSNVELRLTPTKTNTNVKLKAISTTV